MPKSMPTKADFTAWSRRKLRCFHTWDWLGETTESNFEWCLECGAIKRTRDTGTKVFLPKCRQVKK